MHKAKTRFDLPIAGARQEACFALVGKRAHVFDRDQPILQQSSSRSLSHGPRSNVHERLLRTLCRELSWSEEESFRLTGESSQWTQGLSADAVASAKLTRREMGVEILMGKLAER